MSLPQFSEVVRHLSKSHPIPNLSHLCSNFPIFPINSAQIRILKEPRDFYQELLSRCRSAKCRIVLASLYIGTGQLEQNLVSAIRNRMEAEPNLKVRWLLDYTRASRNSVNSRTLLLPTLDEKPINCAVSLYHTPKLRGLLKLLMPQRWNETVGLQHMKIYIFDSSVIVSGANLSNDYFENRQDRYVVIDDCAPLADFYEDLVKIVSSHSFQLTKNNRVLYNQHSNLHPFKGNYRKYCGSVKNAVETFWRSHVEKSKLRLINLLSSEPTDWDSLVIPTVQMPPFGIHLDSLVTHDMISSAPTGSHFHLASGYFNLTDEYANSILTDSNAEYDIICAHPKANGFLGAKGFAGGIPAAYTNLCRLFYEKALKMRVRHRIRIYEYLKEGWTFHAKGLWYFYRGPRPIYTMIGSPNFGYRSVDRDLETQLIISTSGESLRAVLEEERSRLFDRAQLVSERTFQDPDRKVPLWVKLFTFFCKKYF